MAINEKEFWTVKANFKLKNSEEGGRKTGIINGYRPNHVFEYDKENKMVNAYMGFVTFEEQETITPGQETIVKVLFIPGQPIQKFLIVGRTWWIHEGANCVGEAVILEV